MRYSLVLCVEISLGPVAISLSRLVIISYYLLASYSNIAFNKIAAFKPVAMVYILDERPYRATCTAT
jgi:hypothetical protein